MHSEGHESESPRVTQRIYQCTECEHRIKIYEVEEQTVFCQCHEDGPSMIPVDMLEELA